MLLSKSSERLFLQKDIAQNIFVDLHQTLPQHQIDGIRFLFRQFKKKAPSVILNDPSGYGKCLQTVLFLTALLPTLKKPILIVSNSIQNWKEHFINWTAVDDEVAIGQSNPFSKKQISIVPIIEGPAFSRRSWSIVVLHDEYCTWELLTMSFNADYKIWITSDDLKENLRALASIYEWLHPNQQFNVENFTVDWTNWRDAVEKALLLDAFLEDFLIRRTDFLTPFVKPEIDKHKPSLPSPVKATRKNKDPTGTKVKRSKKRRIEDDDITSNQGNTSVNETSNNDASKDNATTTKLDVEAFIRHENPIESEEFNFIQNSNKTSQDSVTVTGKVPESINVDFRNAAKQIVEHTISTNDSDDINIDFSIICQDTENKITVENTERIIEIDDEGNESRIIAPATEDDNDFKTIFGENNNEINIVRNEELIGNTKGDDVTRKSAVNIPETDIENSESTQSDLNNDILSLDGENSAQSQSNDWKIKDVVVKEENALPENKDSNVTKSINGNGNKGVNDDKTNFDKTKDVVKKKAYMDEFDAQMAEMEAKALKKLKGSILDSLF